MSKLLNVSRKKYGNNAFQMSYYKNNSIIWLIYGNKKMITRISLGSFFGDFIHS
jgi:hypothetical protein